MNATQHTKLAKHYRARYDAICNHPLHIADRGAMFRKWMDHANVASRLAKYAEQDSTARGLMALGIINA